MDVIKDNKEIHIYDYTNFYFFNKLISRRYSCIGIIRKHKGEYHFYPKEMLFGRYVYDFKDITEIQKIMQNIDNSILRKRKR